MATQTPATTTTASPGTPEPVPPWTVNLDIAALLWPIVIAIIFLRYKDAITNISTSLASRVTKLEFAGVSLDLAKEATAKPYVLDLPKFVNEFDLAHEGTSTDLNDDSTRTFLKKLAETGTADYAIINLGTGKEWLTSRLYIMAILFARIKGLKALVFVETMNNLRGRYVGWAESEKVRWAMANHYPWLERAYAAAYQHTLEVEKYLEGNANGKVEELFSSIASEPSANLFLEFLKHVQEDREVTDESSAEENWLLMRSKTYEHASWITSKELEDILGKDLVTDSISMSELRAKKKTERLQLLLSRPEPYADSELERYIAITTELHRFHKLIDRSIILEKVAQEISSSA
jgi:hypothetical protein